MIGTLFHLGKWMGIAQHGRLDAAVLEGGLEAKVYKNRGPYATCR